MISSTELRGLNFLQLSSSLLTASRKQPTRIFLTVELNPPARGLSYSQPCF
jgi:hypothetical protein